MHWLHTAHHDRSEKYLSTFDYGGDLARIVQHLDHLERLGVKAMHLNPAFTAYSTHRYYTHVDPHLGGDEALIALRRRLYEESFFLSGGRTVRTCTRSKSMGGNTIT